MSGFPARILEPDTVLFRVHRAANGPAYFGASGAMRFDPPPTHVHRFGTCYVAETEIACFLEVFGDLPVVAQGEIDLRRTTTFIVKRSLRLADLTNRRVLGRYRVDGSAQAGMNRTATRHLAGERYDEGFDGVLYRIRHDPQLRHEAVALFHRPGSHPTFFGKARTRAISAETIRTAGSEFGIDVLPEALLP